MTRSSLPFNQLALVLVVLPISTQPPFISPYRCDRTLSSHPVVEWVERFAGIDQRRWRLLPWLLSRASLESRYRSRTPPRHRQVTIRLNQKELVTLPTMLDGGFQFSHILSLFHTSLLTQ